MVDKTAVVPKTTQKYRIDGTVGDEFRIPPHPRDAFLAALAVRSI